MSGRERTEYFEHAPARAATLKQALGEALVQTCVLPWPPSVNQLAKVDRRGRAAYRDEAITALRHQRIRAYERPERVAIRIWCYAPDQRARDLDNLAKAPIDALQAGGILFDDQQVDDLRLVRRTADPAMPRLELAIAQLVTTERALEIVEELEVLAVSALRMTEVAGSDSAEPGVRRVLQAAQALRTKIAGAGS